MHASGKQRRFILAKLRVFAAALSQSFDASWFMAKILLLLGFSIFGIASNVMAQKQKSQANIPTCTVESKDLPKVRGFNLGQPYSEVAARFESVKNDGIELIPESFLSVYFYSETDSSKEFSGIQNMTFSFYNAKLSRFQIEYSGFEAVNVRNFINQVASNFKLPVEG